MATATKTKSKASGTKADPAPAPAIFGAARHRQPKKLIAKAKAKGGDDAVHGIKPVAIAASLDPRFDPTDPETLLQKCVEITPVVNPLLDAALVNLGMTRRGVRGYIIGTGKATSEKQLLGILEALPQQALFLGSELKEGEKKGVRLRYRYSPYGVHSDLSTTTAGKAMVYADCMRALHSGKTMDESATRNPVQKTWINRSFVGFTSTGSQLHITVCTGWGKNNKAATRPLSFFDGCPDLNLIPFSGHKEPALVTPAVAIAALEAAVEHGFRVVDAGQISELRKALQESVLAERIAGSPGRARLVVSAKAEPALPNEVRDQLEDFGPADGTRSLMVAETSPEIAASAIARVKKSGAAFQTVLHPQVADVISMSKAKPSGKRDPLRPYQDEAVSLHRSTSFGYVNASAPGLGKTIMSLQACREQAKDKGKDWKGLVVGPAAIRSQWIDEVGRWFPEASVATFTSSDAAKALTKLIAEAKGGPVVAVVSYDVMRAAEKALGKYVWDQFILDEAAILGSTGTGRSQAAWALRKRSRCVAALTGTPINRSLDDLGRIVAWVRDDEEMFHGKRLSQRFDMSDDEGVEALWEAIGPTVFRRDRSEIADQLPRIDTEVIMLDPTPQEKALAEGALKELRRAYDALVERVEAARKVNPDDPKLKAAQASLKKVRGAVLGGVTLARKAASDPASLVGSKSAGAALLDTAGLLQPALKNGGTKREQIVGLTDDLVARGESVLLFTDFYGVAKAVADDLAARGIRVGTFTGQGATKAREQNVKDFQAGKLDALVLTGAGREGLNLQRASVLVHLDTPWVPSQLVQRTGRAARFGSTADRLQVLIPIMAGTIEQRVAAVLIPRAVTALRALDTHRGVDGADTEMGLALHGLEEAVDEDMLNEGDKGLFDLAADCLGSKKLSEVA